MQCCMKSTFCNLKTSTNFSYQLRKRQHSYPYLSKRQHPCLVTLLNYRRYTDSFMYSSIYLLHTVQYSKFKSCYMWSIKQLVTNDVE